MKEGDGDIISETDREKRERQTVKAEGRPKETGREGDKETD